MRTMRRASNLWRRAEQSLRPRGPCVARRSCRHFSADTHLLWKGVQSTSFSGNLEFRDGSETTFPVFQVLNSKGELQEGVDLPFSLEEGVQMMELMVKSKVYDDVLLTMQRQGRISFYCTNYGEEATSVGTAAALKPQDMIWPQYRELGAFLWRGLTAQEIADQNIGNEGDRSKGRNLQVHYCMLEKNMQTVHAVLGTQIPQAPGAGYAYKLDGEDRVSVAYFGDGAASEGDAFTGLNFASVYGSQTLFICRNNGYSISTGVEDQCLGFAGDCFILFQRFPIPSSCLSTNWIQWGYLHLLFFFRLIMLAA